jgi:CubicO group peptidase (beta-lactamase class C family)
MMNKYKRTLMQAIFLGVYLLTGIGNNTYGQTKIDKIDKLISTYAEYGKFNGTVLVAEKGKVIYKKGFGSANMEWNIPNQPDTKFRLGSITKQFTSMLILQLVQQGKLKLDAPVSTYLPDYPKSNGDVITIHHLLTHTSGTPNYTSFPGYFKDRSHNPYSPTEFLKYFADSALQFKPGERFFYSNSGYFLLGVIIEKVTGKSYEQVLQENIFTPLRMNNTGYDHHNTILKNRASAYEKNGRSYVNADYIDMSIPYAAGSLYSTVEDLYLWDQALYSNQLLQKENMDLLFTKHIPSGRSYYGYGWSIGEMPIGNTKEQLQTISHSGGINGFTTLITRIPSDKSLIVVLNNTGGAPLQEMTSAISGILYDKSYDLPKKSIAYSLLDVIEKNGIAAALAYYKDVKDFKDYFLDDNEMIFAGYELLKSGKAKEAASVFKLDVEAFPKSFNAYDSYGEALLVLGDKAQAIENYKKSVKLNPGNENGIKILKEQGVNTDDLITKVSVEHLKLLEGEYVEVDPPNGKGRKIIFKEMNGVLNGNDAGYAYKLVPVGEDEFVNPDDGASLVFDSKDKNAVTLLLFGKIRLKKVM